MFFEKIYRWFTELFGFPLAERLSGYNSTTETLEGANMFFPIGIVTLVIALLFMLLYYYVINHPRFNRWWSWISVLAFTAIVNLFVGFFWTKSYALEDKVGVTGNVENIENIADTENVEDMENIDTAKSIKKIENTKNVETINLVNTSNCWGFGFANFLVSIGWFFVLSFAFKWKSRNCKYSPF